MIEGRPSQAVKARAVRAISTPLNGQYEGQPQLRLTHDGREGKERLGHGQAVTASWMVVP